jgi:hypothetical protein
MIQENKGFWPEELSDHEAVRKHLHFTEIIVSFSGTANVSGCSVYAQKVYDWADVNIGYSFAAMLAKHSDKLIVDHILLNDVTEQMGGGAEPLRGIFQGASQPASVAAAAAVVRDGAVDAARTVAETTRNVGQTAVEGVKVAATRSGNVVSGLAQAATASKVSDPSVNSYDIEATTIAKAEVKETE